MDSGVVVRFGLRTVTIDLFGQTVCPPDTVSHPGPKASPDGQHPGSPRRRQVRLDLKGTLIYTDEYDIDSRLVEWGYGHEMVCHAAGELARDDDGDEFCEVHVNTVEGFWSLLRSWLRPHRGIPQESLPLYLGFFEFGHNVRARGNRLPGAMIGLLLGPPRIPS